MKFKYPICNAHLVKKDADTLLFRTNENDITLPSHGDLIMQLLFYCNGTIPLDGIVNSVSEDGNYDAELVKAIIEDLFSLEILCDSREQIMIAHNLIPFSI